MFRQICKNIDDVLRKEAGCATGLDDTEQTSWMLFLKYLGDLEQEKALAAELTRKPYTFIIDKPHRWSSWAAPKRRSAGTCLASRPSPRAATAFFLRSQPVPARPSSLSKSHENCSRPAGT